ncbi:unnamed protein product [Closterium sp. Naga37s-1]|nr:unnamed protein product [Closterium sp. Naga37s-1]
MFYPSSDNKTHGVCAVLDRLPHSFACLAVAADKSRRADLNKTLSEWKTRAAARVRDIALPKLGLFRDDRDASSPWAPEKERSIEKIRERIGLGADPPAMRDMELHLVHGMVLKVQLEEVAGGVGERVAALETKLREQGDAMAALKRDVADMRRAMAHVKGMMATGALAVKSEGEGGLKRSAPGEAAEGIGTQLPKGARLDNAFAELDMEEVKA